MDISRLEGGRVGVGKTSRWLWFLLGCAGPFLEIPGGAQERESLAGEKAAQALKEAVLAEAQKYNMQLGPVRFQLGAGVQAGYTDNVFYSQTNRMDDFVIEPQANLAAFMQVSEINTLRLSLGLGYEYYVKHSVLNANAPLVNPDSELAFNLFVGDFRIRLHEKFSYQETLFINTGANGQDLLFNFNNVGTFVRWDNLAGFNLDWDLNKFILSAGYNHENFESSTASFEYLNRASEWFTASAAFLLGDQAKIGLESKASLHDYQRETVLNDHWRARGGPFVEVMLPEKISFRAGGGYDTARYDSAGAGSDFKTYYAYGKLSQETRFFTHSLSAGREDLLGENANNLEDTYVRYAISSPVVDHLDLDANASVHFDKEFGGGFAERFTYYVVGLKAGYQFNKYWRADLVYEFMLKNSNLDLRTFDRDRVTLGVTFTF